MIIWMMLTFVGLGLPVAGIAGVIIGVTKKKMNLWIASVVIPVVYWVGFYFLWQADQEFIRKETEKNGGETPGWVW